MNFEWDAEKAKRNRLKHGLSFELAARVFSDPNRLESYDCRHDEDEDRWISIGMVYPAIVVVVHTERESGTVIRIISARRANEQEQKAYCRV